MAVNDSVYKMSKSNAEVVLLIGMNIDNENKIIMIDTVGETSITASSTLTEHPMPNGEMAADHMFKDPVSLNISGEFPLINGNPQTLFIDESGAYLANVEETFERIKNEGIVCEIAKINANDNNVRFKRRSSMVLTSISWTEKISSLSFTFNFKEVQFVDVQEYEVDSTDPNAPNPNFPKQSKFTDVLFDSNEALRQVVKLLIDKDLLEDKLWSSITTLDNIQLSAILGGAAFLITVVMAVCATTPVGWALAAIGLAIAGFYFLVKGIGQIFKNWSIKQKYGIKPWKYKKNEKKRNEVIESVCQYIGKCKENFDVLNDSIKVYQLSTNDQQEVLLSVNDQLCSFTFTKNNAVDRFEYDCKVDLYADGQNVSTKQEICSSAPTSFYEINSAEPLADFGNGIKGYILCPTENRDDLTNFMIVITSISPEDMMNIIADITIASLRENKD